MTLPLLILRPQPGADATAGKARALGLNPVVAPLFAVEAVSWDMPDPNAYNALLLSSANAVRHLGKAAQQLLNLPVLAVGRATAEAAQDAGLTAAHIGSAGIHELLDEADAQRFPRLLRLSGEDFIAIDAPHFQIDHRIVYRSVTIPLSEEARAALAAPNVTLLHSPRAARTLAKAMEQAGLSRAQSHLVALSVNVADAAGSGWLSVSIADRPDDDTLLRIAASLCQGA